MVLRTEDLSAVVAQWGRTSEGAVPELILAEEQAGPLCAELPHVRDAQGRARSVVAAVGDGAVRAWMDVAWPAEVVPDPRRGVMTRVLARFAGAVVSGRPEALLVGAETLTELALTAETFDQLLGGVAAVVAPSVDAALVGIAVMNDRGYLQALPGSFGAAPDLVASSQVSHTEVTTAAAAVFRSGRPMLANDPRTDIPRFFDWVEGFGIRRLMTLPIVVGETPLGVLHVANKAVPFTEEDAATVGRLTSFVAGAVGQVHQRIEMRHREGVSAVVGRAATAMASGVRLSGFGPFLAELREVLGCRTVVLRVPGTEPLVATADESVVGRDVEFLVRSDDGAASVRSAMSRPLVVGEPGWVTLHVPVLVDGRPRASLGLLRIPGEPFREPEQAAVRRMAGIVALGWTTDRFLAEQAETARVRERERIADGIHDRAVQLLFSGKLTLQRLLEQLDGSERDTAARALSLLVRSEDAIREVIHHLAPFTGAAEPLGRRLVGVADEVHREFGVDVEVTQAAAACAVDPGAQAGTALLAAAREAMVNAAKHAGPCHVRVDLGTEAPDALELAVRDDGTGLAPGARPGYGTEAVRRRLAEHGGELLLRSDPGSGTEVLVRVRVT
ncbi:GAF domain-containing sensor histidine kinase [Pseudonocardia halophobica]|uniref:GAF domain-containing sensor histidine kinase n=1 Tax=Pseudonocardia halophobica TaxID=29401 RepID=UPI003D8E5D08